MKGTSEGYRVGQEKPQRSHGDFADSIGGSEQRAHQKAPHRVEPTRLACTRGPWYSSSSATARRLLRSPALALTLHEVPQELTARQPSLNHYVASSVWKRTRSQAPPGLPLPEIWSTGALCHLSVSLTVTTRRKSRARGLGEVAPFRSASGLVPLLGKTAAWGGGLGARALISRVGFPFQLTSLHRTPPGSVNDRWCPARAAQGGSFSSLSTHRSPLTYEAGLKDGVNV